MKVFRDPVHDIISFDKAQEKYILDLIDSKEMQRLRRIRQLGLSSYTYPGAEHSRFAHSLGTAFLMKRVMGRLYSVRNKQEKQWLQEVFDNRDLVLCSALLHDIGHGPFSHAIEDVMGIKHEVWTMQIINNPDTEVHKILETYKSGFAKEVADVIARVHPCEMAVKLLSSQLDVDRFDYLLRDSLITGVGYGKFDLEWMINTLTIGLVDGVPEIGLDLDKGLSIAEDFVMARYYMYKHVYFHKTTRGAEIITRKILNRAKALIISKEIECPPYLDVLFLSKPEDKEKYLSSYLELDDNILWYWFHQWVNSDDKLLSNLCGRLLNRKLLKSRDISGINVVNLLSHLKVLEKSPYGDLIEVDNPSTSSYKDPYISKRTRTETDGIEEDKEHREATEQIFLFDISKKHFELTRKSPIIFAIRDQTIEQERLHYPVELQGTVAEIFG
ncbi:MAG: HD domain-containing protein [Parabacteroides sp.]|nr:HD domain-containing protein [Parabacteroides sp.]